MNIKQLSVLLARIALFIVYVWFGALKIVGLSPASTMVEHLFKTPMVQTMMPGFITFSIFIIIFGVFEVIIGILFIIPGQEKKALILFFLHMITTMLPLFIMSEVWTKMFVPTLEGQYIIKNLALMACALNIYSSTKN